MDLLFSEKHTYFVNKDLSRVKSEIKSITDRKGRDFSENIIGNINADNSFTLTHKWSLAIIKWIENSPAYLSGTLNEEDNKTIIKTSIRPNSGLVFFFYFLIILFLCELFGFNSFIQGPKTVKLVFFICFSLILFGLMKMYTLGLQNRFERILKLKRNR